MNTDQIYDLIEAIGAVSGRNEKEKLLEVAINDETLIEVLRYANDPLITFGITPPKRLAREVGCEFDEVLTWSLLEKLRARTLTGNAARD